MTNFDTPDTLSPDDAELAPIVKKPQIQIDTGEEKPAPRHSISAPERVDTPSTDAEAAAPLEGQGEKVSPAEKG